MPTKPIQPPVLPKTPALPEPGLYFDMPFETYLAVPAVGSSLLWDALVEPYLAWARSWLNPLKDEPEKDHFLFGRAFHCIMLEGREAYADRYYVEPDKRAFEELLVTDADVTKAIAEFEETPVKGAKPARVAQLLELWPEAPIWDEIQRRAAEEGEGRDKIKFDWHTKFEASRSMIEQDPELLELMANGHAEVSLFWHCPRTGIPKKARADLLKLDGFVDLKTFANTHEKSLRRAVPQAIANEKYPFQPSHYLEGAEVVRALVREALKVEGAGLPIFQSVDGFDEARTQWAIQWAAAEDREPDSWHWLFVQKGDAPVAIGVQYDVGGNLREQFDEYAATASGIIAQWFESHGADPWIEQHGIVALEDTMVPAYVLEV